MVFCLPPQRVLGMGKEEKGAEERNDNREKESYESYGKKVVDASHIMIPVEQREMEFKQYKQGNLIKKMKLAFDLMNGSFYYLHILLLYVVVYVLFLELKTLQQNIYNFNLEILNISMIRIETEMNYVRDVTLLKKSLADLSKLNGIEAGMSNNVFDQARAQSTHGFDPSPTHKVSRRSIINKPQKKRVCSNCHKGPTALHLMGSIPEVEVRDGDFTGLIAPWMNDEEAPGEFPISHNISSLTKGDGLVEVNKSGLYFIYSQVYYLTSSKMNSYNLMCKGKPGKEDRILSTCSVSNTSSERVELSCYTAVIRYLDRGDKVFLKQRERNRKILLREGQTYLGLVLLRPKYNRRNRKS